MPSTFPDQITDLCGQTTHQSVTIPIWLDSLEHHSHIPIKRIKKYTTNISVRHTTQLGRQYIVLWRQPRSVVPPSYSCIVPNWLQPIDSMHVPSCQPTNSHSHLGETVLAVAPSPPSVKSKTQWRRHPCNEPLTHNNTCPQDSWLLHCGKAFYNPRPANCPGMSVPCSWVPQPSTL
jgi:hypothetical protein